MSSIQALLFDFDGLILDTETPERDTWKDIYAEYGFDYPLERWSQNVGIWGTHIFDPAGYLHELTRDSLNVEALRARHKDASTLAIARQPVRDGVLDYLAGARRLGLRTAIASASPRFWVETHLARLGILDDFDQLVTSDDVPPGRVKPHPDIYLKAVERLGVTPAQAIAFEDSPPGITAARAAGVFAVAVPNPTTALLSFDGAHIILTSMSNLSLDDLLLRASKEA